MSVETHEKTVDPEKEGKLLNAALGLLALIALGAAGWTAAVGQLRGGIDDLFLILIALLVAFIASINPLVTLYKKGVFMVEDEPEVEAAGAHAHDDHEVGGSTKLFITVWLVLLALTAVEVVLAYEQVNLIMMLIILMGASIIKAVLIVAYFMHLKFERMSLILTLVPSMVACLLLMLVFFPDSKRSHDLRPATVVQEQGAREPGADTGHTKE